MNQNQPEKQRRVLFEVYDLTNAINPISPDQNVSLGAGAIIKEDSDGVVVALNAGNTFPPLNIKIRGQPFPQAIAFCPDDWSLRGILFHG